MQGILIYIHAYIQSYCTILFSHALIHSTHDIYNRVTITPKAKQNQNLQGSSDSNTNDNNGHNNNELAISFEFAQRVDEWNSPEKEGELMRPGNCRYLYVFYTGKEGIRFHL